MAKKNKSGLKRLKDNLDFISFLHKTRTAKNMRVLLTFNQILETIKLVFNGLSDSGMIVCTFIL